MELRFEHITKHYGAVTALRDIDLVLAEGIYGILGPNGAGKSTLMNILTGNLEASEGRVLLDGEDAVKLGEGFRRRVGYCPQQQTLYPSFTPWQFWPTWPRCTVWRSKRRRGERRSYCTRSRSRMCRTGLYGPCRGA